jgi:hypothetical protein
MSNKRAGIQIDFTLLAAAQSRQTSQEIFKIPKFRKMWVGCLRWLRICLMKPVHI